MSDDLIFNIAIGLQAACGLGLVVVFCMMVANEFSGRKGSKSSQN